MDQTRKKRRRAEDTGDGHTSSRLKRPMLGVGPSPPSPPADSNDREVSMILGHEQTQRESPPSSQHYSIHSSLLTDLSLTPSPPADQPPSSPKPENQSRDVDTPDNDDDDNDDDAESADRSNSTNGDSVNQSKSRSSSSSSGSSSCDSQSSPLRTVETSLTTPQETRCSEELTDDLSQSPPTSPHFNTPDALEPAISVSSFQHKDILGLQGPSSSSLSLSLDTLPCSSSTPKPCSINNNLLCSPLPSPYCSPSPAYSIPSPGSAFSVVISRRRESET